MSENLHSELEEALPAIERLAGKVWKDHGGRLRQGREMVGDLIGEGTVAFIKAMEDYDPDKGITPLGHTHKNIWGAMIDAIRKSTMVGNTANGSGTTVSLDAFVDGDEMVRRIDRLASREDSAEARLIDNEVNTLIKKAIQGLTDREKQIMEGLFEAGKTAVAVGEMLHLSGRKVGQLRGVIIGKLRAALASADSEDAPRVQGDYMAIEYIVGEDGVVELPNGRKAIELYAYARHIGYTCEALRSMIKGTGIRPIRGVRGRRSTNSRSRPNRLYPKDAIDRYTIMACQLDASGITTLPDGREAVCIEPYGRYIKMPSLNKMVGTHRLKPIYEFVGRTLRSDGKRGNTAKLYLRKDVDLLIEILKKSPRRRRKR